MDWPAAMRFENAVKYLDIEGRTTGYAVLNQIPSVQYTARGERRWLRADLDLWLESRREIPVTSRRAG